TDSMQTLDGPLIWLESASLSAASVHPTDDSAAHVPVQLMKLPVRVSTPEVVAPSSQHRIQFRDYFIHVLCPVTPHVGQLVNASLDILHRPRRRPPLHEVPTRIALGAPAFANRTPQENEAFLAASQV